MTYERGTLTSLSRGDGNIGEDILSNLKTIKSIPKFIQDKDIPDLLEIRCEIFINKKNFLNISKNFANQETLRGSLRQKNPEETAKIPLEYFAYGFGVIKPMILKHNQIF